MGFSKGYKQEPESKNFKLSRIYARFMILQYIKKY